MPSETIVNLVVNSLVVGAAVGLLWTRLNRLETSIDEVKRDLARTREEMATKTDFAVTNAEIVSIRNTMATKADLDSFRASTRAEFDTIREQMATKADIDRLHGEMVGMRDEMAVMRSDLTHVALAVGANRPKPMER